MIGLPAGGRRRLKSYTIQTYSLDAGQITSGTISTTRLSADVVTTNTLTAKISEADAIWTKNLFVWSGTASIPNALINNINGQPLELLIRGVVRAWPWSATIDGVPATIQFN